MQAIDLFTLVVAAVGMIHLIVGLSARVSAAWGIPRSHKPKGTGVRPDWYVFFRCSSLYGTSNVAAGTPRNRHRSAAPRASSHRSRPRAILFH